MKLYQKIDNNGILHVMPYNKIVIIKDDMQIFNPTEEMLLEDGWVEHKLPETNVSDEEVLAMEKEHIIDDILTYDSSPEINLFYVNDIPVWLDKATRSGLMLRFQAEKEMGVDNTTLWYGEYVFTLPVDTAVKVLYAVEVYASQCYDRTQYHINAIKRLKTVDDIKAYDYKAGYPEKLKF